MVLDTGEIRYYTVREAAVLQTFPTTWQFDSTWSRAFAEIGNAVPPLLGKMLGAAVLRALEATAPSVPAPVQAACVAEPTARLDFRWVPVRSLADTARGRVARLAAARMESFARPVVMLAEGEARIGALYPTTVNTSEPPTAGSTAMTPVQAEQEAAQAVSTLRALLEAKIAELAQSTTEASAYVGEQLRGWLSVLRPPSFGDVDASVMQQAARPTDPELANISFPAFVRGVTTPPLPPLPQPPPPAAR